MKQCPHCGGQLQEQAQFCLYCMRPLTDKPDVTPTGKNRKKIGWLLAVGPCLVIAAVVAAVFLLRPEEDEKKPKTPDTPVYQKIASFEDFSLRAVYLSGKNSLTDIWDPDSLLHTHTGEDSSGDTWKIYSADVHLQEVTYRAHFCQDGIEILTAITGLTEENYRQGLDLAQCTISSVYNYTFTNLEDMLTDPQTYPRSPVAAGEDLLTLAELPDPTAQQTDEGTAMQVQRLGTQLDDPGQYLFLEFRTRTWQGETVSDILILCTQDFAD